MPNSITYIDWSDFSECSIKTVFYTGLKNEWNAIKTRFNTPAKLKIVCKKKYHFITNCKNSLPDITAYAIEASPEVKNDGKAFIGWYDNEALSGKPITFPYSGDSETLYAAWKDNAGTSFDDYIVIDADNPNTITAGNPQQPIYYRFVPSLTDLYVACAAGGTCCVYDSKKVLLECDNDIGNGKGYKLTAGETYYFTVTGNGTVDFNIKSSALPATTTKRSFVDGKNVFTTVPENLPINTQIILVCYKDGKFAGIQVGRNENKTLRFVTDKEVDYARVMAVESLDSMKPLGYAERVQ